MTNTKGSSKPWLPTAFTQPLSENFPSDGPMLCALADKHFRFEASDEYKLEEWQRDLINRVLERYPDDHPEHPGELRYRQVVISVGRQNGKSVLAAVLSLYGLILMVTRGAKVIGLASTREQAAIVYGKSKFAVESSELLSKRFKTTRGMGITSRDPRKPASYVIKTGKGDALQGASVNLCLFDELHISDESAWDAMVFGQSAQKDAMLIGITTAGDDNSVLLKRLYETGRKAAGGTGDERFGFFLWEAPEHLDPYSDEAIKLANPAIASGRLDVEAARRDMKSMPESQARRYRLNQFIAAENAWMPAHTWAGAAGDATDYRGEQLFFAIDKSFMSWDSVSVVASFKRDGMVYTSLAATLTLSNLAEVAQTCRDLYGRWGGSFLVDVGNFKDLADLLNNEGYECHKTTAVDMSAATETTYAMVTDSRLVHAGDEVLTREVVRAVTTNKGEGHIVSRKNSAGSVDSVIATVMAVWAAETKTRENGGVFFFKSTV